MAQREREAKQPHSLDLSITQHLVNDAVESPSSDVPCNQRYLPFNDISTHAKYLLTPTEGLGDQHESEKPIPGGSPQRIHSSSADGRLVSGGKGECGVIDGKKSILR